VPFSVQVFASHPVSRKKNAALAMNEAFQKSTLDRIGFGDKAQHSSEFP
jgi:hypothetical protein